MTDRDALCLVCGEPEPTWICHRCGADGWTEKAVIQELARRLGGVL